MKKELKVKKHTDRTDLTGEHPFGDLGQLIFLVIFILVWIADIFVFKISESDYLDIPLWLLIPCGSIILTIGFYLARKSMVIIFGTKREKPELIHEKVYDYIRHPMYLGALLFYLGVSIIMYSAPLFILFVLIFLFYNFIAKHEEKLLLDKFGDSYALYIKKVRRWIPRIFTKK
jgi:protein-S-isoprenylcysteine O-methyltransferase Ste14